MHFFIEHGIWKTPYCKGNNNHRGQGALWDLETRHALRKNDLIFKIIIYQRLDMISEYYDCK